MRITPAGRIAAHVLDPGSPRARACSSVRDLKALALRERRDLILVRLHNWSFVSASIVSRAMLAGWILRAAHPNSITPAYGLLDSIRPAGLRGARRPRARERAGPARRPERHAGKQALDHPLVHRREIRHAGADP